MRSSATSRFSCSSSSTCKADAKGNCHLVGQVEILDPDGARYGEPARLALWDNHPAPPPTQLVLSPGTLGLTVEDGEKLGNYTIRLAVTDVNAGVTAHTEQVITVVEAGVM